MYSLFLLWLVKDVCEAAFAAVLPVEVGGHEHTGSTILVRALTAQACDLAVLVNLAKQHS